RFKGGRGFLSGLAKFAQPDGWLELGENRNSKVRVAPANRIFQAYLRPPEAKPRKVLDLIKKQKKPTGSGEAGIL
ncbi:MAG: hypothetical protein IJP07_07435, partial [Firmicutes bacterium]|nr:hypothetical protein [Bacillota bacterium]